MRRAGLWLRKALTALALGSAGAVDSSAVTPVTDGWHADPDRAGALREPLLTAAAIYFLRTPWFPRAVCWGAWRNSVPKKHVRS